MAWRNSVTDYGKVTRFFHWFIAFTVMTMLLVGSLMVNLDSKFLKGLIYPIHKLVGILVLFSGLAFCFWSFFSQKPAYPTTMKPWEKNLAHSVQKMLYLLLILMPLAGWAMSTAVEKYPSLFGLITFKLPLVPHSKAFATFMASLHELFAWALFLLISLHTIGALKHHYWDKNNILKRMWRGLEE